jgi:PAS domain S-box-containing protein
MADNYSILHQYKLILNAAGEGIYGLDIEGKATFANPAAIQMTGWTEDDIIGKAMHEKHHHTKTDGSHYPQHECPIYAALKDSEVHYITDEVFWRKDGSSFPVHYTSTPIIENNVITGAVVIFQDISKIRDSEKNLKKALFEIEQLKDKLNEENIYLQEEININHKFEDILGESQSLKTVLQEVEQVANTDTTVLIQGETGTGKELFARSLHCLSERKQRPLVKVNCAALPENLIESELFGHEKGSFTGATARRIGRFELAHEGTIFLDEIAELPLELQAKLLRVLQEGEIERLGDSKTIKVNVRVIAATHRNLKKMIAEGTFREDLYYRLSVFPLDVPPLRERRNDISLLTQWFTNKYANKTGKLINNIPKSSMDNLLGYDWPGNVRELENIIERAVILTTNNILHIPALQKAHSNAVNNSADLLSLAQMEKSHLIKVLESTGWAISGESGAASILEMHPNTLRSRMSKLGIRRASTAK